MSSPIGFILRLAGAVVLVLVVSYGAWGRAPHRAAPARDLRRLVIAAVVLYAVGVAAVLARRSAPSVAAFAGGVATASLAAWLSRGGSGDGGDDGGGGGRPPIDRTPPPPGPDGVPEIDWAHFDRERHSWERPGPRTRPPAGV